MLCQRRAAGRYGHFADPPSLASGALAGQAASLRVNTSNGIRHIASRATAPSPRPSIWPSGATALKGPDPAAPGGGSAEPWGRWPDTLAPKAQRAVTPGTHAMTRTRSNSMNDVVGKGRSPLGLDGRMPPSGSPGLRWLLRPGLSGSAVLRPWHSAELGHPGKAASSRFSRPEQRP